MDRWVVGWMEEKAGLRGWVDGWRGKRTKYLAGRKDGWVDGWMDGWVDGWRGKPG